MCQTVCVIVITSTPNHLLPRSLEEDYVSVACYASAEPGVGEEETYTLVGS